MVKRRSGVARWLLTLAEALLIASTLIFLAECFGWRLLREAGGGATQRNIYRLPLP